jgi:hypothetical protein
MNMAEGQSLEWNDAAIEKGFAEDRTYPLF